MNKERLHTVTEDAGTLLRGLIAIPSLSREEAGTAQHIAGFLQARGVSVKRYGHNVLARNRHYRPGLPTWLLNSHHDTVKPNPGYTRAPFVPAEIDGKLYGLGSNDAGGPLVSLIAAFLYFYEEPDLPFNLVLAATAEEEISGTGGIESVLPLLGPVDGALVGEPTQMQLAIAERGLLVIDAEATGRAGHAARNEGDNALVKAVADIQALYATSFDKVSPFLGPVSLNVTVIETENKAHNVVPDTCRFVVDVRLNECYTHEEVLALLQSRVQSTLTPRSCRLRSTLIAESHPLVQAGLALGRSTYGSPTSSDKALMPFPALKIGPGDSARSHTADEYIHLHEIREGIELYIELLKHTA
ncbi:M20 family metallo-hydrolase [Flaviaesturariibacter amylovorans]|uniref:M20 family metallo-hydrolase n=1 Tax=Flaviaesturariibacter amylovorans TaxID=1084520 RepID=A0ABP8GJH3_9BACT